jgi:hypothetical protein
VNHHRLVIAAAVIATGSALVHAEPQPAKPRIKVGIVPSIAVNVDAARVDALGQDLADALTSELDIDALGGLEVRRQLPTDGVPPECATTPACSRGIAQKLGVTEMLFVVMIDSGAGGSVEVDPTWVDGVTGKTHGRPPIDLTSSADADARQKFSAAAHALLPDAPLKPKPKPGGSIQFGETTSTPRHITTPMIIAGGAAVVGLGVGIGFGLEARSKYNACNSDPSCRNVPTDPRRGSIRSTDYAADGGWILAVAGAAAATVFWATSGSEARLVVAPTPGGAAVSLGGQF